MASIFDCSDARARAAWRACLAAAFRTAAACAIVACATLYGPASFRGLVGFPAFSYVTVILIVTDASLGDTLRGCWLALYATAQSLGPAMLSLWLIDPSRLTRSVTSLAVALGAFVVALPESTHLVSKRVALGQIVIVYVIGFINGDKTEAVMHTLRVAASTGVGVLACVLALLLPFPRLACKEVKDNSHLFAENASERLKHFVKAFTAGDKNSALESISQAKAMAATGTKLLQTVKRFQESMLWERPPLKCLKPRYCTNPGDRMQELEVPLRGLEMALTNTRSFPVTFSTLNGDQLKDGLQITVENNNTINLVTGIQNDSSISTVPESTELDQQTAFLHTLQDNMPQTHKNLPSFFFLFCVNLVLPTKTPIVPPTKSTTDQDQEQNDSAFDKTIWTSVIPTLKLANNQRLMYAFKSSLSLGLAVFFGLTYSKPDGYWAGLPVAISLSAGREATFRVANLKAQGTVLGTVYGVLGWFLFEKSLPTRLFSLVPWFVFTSFLQRSKMYSQAGSISAVIGAILVLGRKGFGPPSKFAIARIAETFIGLSCSIIVDLLFQPTRASALSKIHLSRSIQTLQECVNSLTFQSNAKLSNLDANRKKLNMCVNELGKFVGEAELEPNFWFMPFPSDCYGKILESLSKMVDLLDFCSRAMGFLDQRGRILINQESIITSLDGDLELFKELVGSSLKYAEEVSRIKSLALLEKELEKSKTSYDIELGKSGKLSLDEDEIDKVVGSYVHHSREVVEKIDDDRELKRQMVLCLSALGFCMSGFMRETREIEDAIKELVQRENPSSRVNLYEISCMIHALKK
ncbi:hypothetical protein L484_001852 [Morus notabilis]|uniref:Integral membrane bound transporter domain-containing protein n=1 Tax=Morus notabilis TaxID=981085 RepID=W9QRU6_9ROSA|nr:uncharacterized protein LOC21385439 [Morus notabilis]EXB52249.1 hypothetical protein L484_001852 [Morus notabilis]